MHDSATDEPDTGGLPLDRMPWFSQCQLLTVACLIVRLVHPLHLVFGPRMPGLHRAVLDVVPGAGIFEGAGAEELAIGVS